MYYCGHSGFIIAVMTCLGTCTFSSIIMFLMQAHLLESVNTPCPLPSRWHFQLLNNYWKINRSHRVTNDPFSSTLSGWAHPVTAREKTIQCPFVQQKVCVCRSQHRMATRERETCFPSNTWQRYGFFTLHDVAFLK